jgi:hypothetical protein
LKTTIITPINYRVETGKWPFILNETLAVNLGLGLRGYHLFMHKGQPIGHLKDDRLRIFQGYASDGASPHFGTIGKVRIGTPSHAKTAPGFFVHDFLYQFAPLKCCPWTYAQADDVLYRLMRNEGSVLAAPYYTAVALLGGLHRRLTRNGKQEISCQSKHGKR